MTDSDGLQKSLVGVGVRAMKLHTRAYFRAFTSECAPPRHRGKLGHADSEKCSDIAML